MEDPQPQKNFRNLIDPGAGFGAFLGKLGDALVKAIDKPLGYAVNWGRYFLYGLFIWKLAAAALS
jgi:hypothetical protein